MSATAGRLNASPLASVTPIQGHSAAGPAPARMGAAPAVGVARHHIRMAAHNPNVRVHDVRRRHATADAAGLVPPRPPMQLVSGRAADEAVATTLHTIHVRNASAPISWPDDCGAFPSSWSSAMNLRWGEARPVVLDANQLRNDLLYACRRDRRTTLVTAANAGAIRLFCASHVVEETIEHASEWVAESKTQLSPAAFLARLVSEYLPLVRVVRDEDLLVLQNLLNPDERLRIEQLTSKDSDDVPSATLALLLGALFLTEDRDPLEAVYGPHVDLDAHRGWLQALRAGGDSAELAKLIFAAQAWPAAVGYGLHALGRWLDKALPSWALAAIAVGFGVGVGVLGPKVSPQTRRKAGAALSDTLVALISMQARHHEQGERFQRAAPTVPTWSQLALTNDSRAVLARACIHALVRAPQSPASARELATALSPLGVGQCEQFVRQTLRSHACFEQPYRGRWQVGRSLCRCNDMWTRG